VSSVLRRRPEWTRSATGIIGLAVLVFVVGVALLGPLFAPHGIATPIGPPGQGPSANAPLGTDFLGRDVLSRLLHGGLSVVWIGTTSTVLAYVAGLTVGLTAGYSRTLVDPLLMRCVDVMLSFPALLVLLLLVSGLGSHVYVLILGVVAVQLPPIARVMRTVTLETATHGYVEAAEMRGERTSSVLIREILPNIAPVMLADFGIRFGYSIILIASVNYLGLGLQPPAADWGLMMSENREFISLNAWAVLAPAVMLALLTIGVNLVADAYVRTLGRSENAAEARVLTPVAIVAAGSSVDGPA
jgi:peptide/nickel transport system permease protein